MTGREILTALTDIDEEYIEEAAKKHKSKKNIIIRFSAMAFQHIKSAAQFGRHNSRLFSRPTDAVLHTFA